VKGSIQKRVGKSGKVTWTCVVDAPLDPVTGKRRQRRLSADTKRELQDMVTKLLHETKTGAYVEPSKQSVRAYLLDWLDAHRPNVRATTYRSYEQLTRVHILPALGSVPLQKLAASDLETFYAAKLADGLSPRTVRYLHTVIRKALQRAFKFGSVVRNVADAASPPRAPRPQAATWDVDQIRDFLTVASDDTYAPAWLVAATTGLRRGELLGLRWCDLDSTAGRLHVRQSLVEI
jgi:integrase